MHTTREASDIDFVQLTEVAGDDVSREQIERLYQRYVWAAAYCKDKRVLEVACGTGQGLGCLATFAAEVVGGDYEVRMLEIARNHYGDRFQLLQLDAQQLPFEAGRFDVIVLFEAIYYLPDAEAFVRECRRVLSPGGQVLIATANKDLFDFTPSPHSHKYYGTVELRDLFEKHGFRAEFFGTTPVARLSWRQRSLRPVKRLVTRLGLMPKSMAGKKLLKRLVFGKLVPMPAEILPGDFNAPPPDPVPGDTPCREYKVILCRAILTKE